MLRLRKKRKRVLRKYYAVLGKITKVRKHGDDYKVIFKNPETKAETTELFFGEDLADLRKATEKGKTETANEKYKEFLIPILRQDRYESFQEQDFQGTFDPLGDGNFQSSVIAHQLDWLGVHRSASKVREEIVKYMKENQNSQQGMSLEMFLGISFRWNLWRRRNTLYSIKHLQYQHYTSLK